MRKTREANGPQAPVAEPVPVIRDAADRGGSHEVVDDHAIHDDFEQLQSLPRRVVRVDVDRHTEGQVVRDVIDMLAVYGVPWTPSATLAVGVVLNML